MSLKQYVEIDFEGKQKLMKFDYNSVADLEAQYGKGIGRILSEEQVGFNTLRTFYSFGLRWKDKGITPQRCGVELGKKMQEGAQMDELFEPVLKALQLSKLIGGIGSEDESEGEHEEGTDPNGNLD